MKSQECRGLGSQRYGVQVHGVLRVWDPGDKGCREQRAQSPRGHGILDLWDPGHTRAWTQGSRAHGVWATAGLCTGAVGRCRRAVPGYTDAGAGGVTPPCPPWQGPAWPVPVLGLPPARPRGWLGLGPGTALQPAHVCAHVLVAKLVALACLQRVTFACSHAL